MKIFKNKTQLQQAKLDASDNQLVMIKGDTTVNDGQTNFYVIVTPGEFGGTPDEVNDLTLANGNIAQLMTGQTRYQDNEFAIYANSNIKYALPQRAEQKIVDGRFDFWFEGTSQASGVSGYGSDTMWLNNESGPSVRTHEQLVLSVQEISDVPTARFASRTIITSSGGAVGKNQRINDVRTYAGKTVTVSLYAKADSNKEIAVRFQQLFGSGGSPSVNSGLLTFNITTDWQRFTGQISIPSISGKTIGSNSALSFNIGFDNTIGLPSQTGTFDIACVQVDEGEGIRPFHELDFQKSKDMVLGYYEKSYRDNEEPGANTNLGRYTGITDNGNTFRLTVNYTTPKRNEAPSISLFDTDGNSGTWSSVAVSPINLSESSFEVIGTGLSSGQRFIGHWVSDARL